MEKLINNYVSMYASTHDYNGAGSYLDQHQLSENVKAYFRESEIGVVYILTLKEVIGMGNRSSRDEYLGYSN